MAFSISRSFPEKVSTFHFDWHAVARNLLILAFGLLPHLGFSNGDGGLVPPANDDACDAFEILLDEQCLGNTFTTTGATSQAGEPSGCSWSWQTRTVWFQFVAPATGAVRINASSFNGSIGLYSATSCGDFASFSELGCWGSNSSVDRVGLVSGNTYFIRVKTDVQFDFCLSVQTITQAPNDDVCDATALVLDQTCAGTPFTTTGASTQANELGGCAWSWQTYTVWFQFVAPATGAVRINASSFNGSIGLYSATSCGDFASFSELGCWGSNSSVDRVGLMAGNTYFIRVKTDVQFDFCLSVEALPTLTNDNACDAPNIPLNQPCQTYTTFGATRQTSEPSGCMTETATVWFKFTAPGSGAVRVNASKLNTNNLKFGLYTATSCSNFATFAQVACYEYGTAAPYFERNGLTAGQVYYLQMAYSYNSITANFCLDIDSLPIPPPNDAACNATEITLDNTCTDFAYTNIGASRQASEPTSCTSTDRTVWFKFTAPASGAVRVNFRKANNQALRAAIFSATDCANFATYAQKSCWSDGANAWFFDQVNLTAGQVYYLQMGYNGNGQTGAFCIEINAITQAANDDVCNATTLTLGQACTGNPYSNAGSSRQTSEPTNCGSESYTVWFKFTAPASGAVRVNADRGTNTQNIRVAMYGAADCSVFGGFTLLRCTQGILYFFDQVNLTAGSTYYIQATFNNNATGNFCLSVDAIDQAPNDDVCNATTLTLGQPCSGNPYTNVGSSRQTSEPTNCSSDNNTVWFKFIAPASGAVRVNADRGTSTQNIRVAMYSAANCSTFGGFTLLRCTQGSQYYFDQVNLTAGSTYYLHVAFNNNAPGNFCLSVDAITEAANDDVCDAIVLGLNQPCTGNPYTNIGSSRQASEPTNCLSDDYTVWFKFVAPPSGAVRINGDKGDGPTNLRLSVYKSTACSPFSGFVYQNVCGVGSQFHFDMTTLVPGATYFMAASYNNNYTGNFCVSLDSLAVPPNNNACNATVLTLGVPCSGLPYTNVGASRQTSEPSACMSDAYTVWFKFTAPASGKVRVNCNQGTGTQSLRVALFKSGNCNTFVNFVQEHCQVGNGQFYFEKTGLINNATYYLQVAYNNGETGNFCLDVYPYINYYKDNDDDNYGVNPPTSALFSNTGYLYYASQNGDCNDANPAINPGAVEICNNIDDDCDTFLDILDPNYVDLIPPVITCPANQTDDNDAGLCASNTVALGSATATDNCQVDNITNNAPGSFPVGSTTVVWTAADLKANTATCSQTVVVQDVELPTITCPANVSQNNDLGQCNATLTVSAATFSDNCTGASTANNAPATFPVGTTTVTHTATDASGNSASCAQTVTISDAENPSITCPANVSQNNDAGQCNAALTVSAATFSDNCTGASTAHNAPATFPVGTTTVTHTATDASGNTAACAQTVTILDAENPSITCPANVSQNNDMGQCNAALTVSAATFSDNCTGASTAHNAPGTFPVGTTIVTHTATDASGNTATCAQTVTITDSEAPTMTCPANITTLTDVGTCGATVSFSGTAADNCSANYISNPASGSIFALGTSIVTMTATDPASNTATCQFTVTVNPRPEVCGNGFDDDCNGLTDDPIVLTLTSQTNVTCNGGNNGALNITPSCGLAPYTYAWSNGATTQDISGLTAGTYTVTTTDNQGLTKTLSATITEAAAIALTFTQVKPTCPGGSNGNIQVNPTAPVTGYTYLWSNGSTLRKPLNLSAGTYSVTVTKTATGCTATGTSVLTDSPPLALTYTYVLPNCAGGTGSITVNHATGTYTYLWSNGATTKTISPVAAGAYMVTVTKTTTGCTATGMATLTEPPAISIANVIVNNKCFGQSIGTVTATATGGTGAKTYLWNTGGTINKIINLPAGIYTVTATDTKGCTNSVAATVTQPPQLALNHVITPIAGNKYKVTLSASGGTPFTTTVPYRYCKVGATGSCAYTTATIYSNLLPNTTYVFRAKDFNSCVVEISVTTPNTAAKPFDRSAESFVQQKSFLSPNPANDEIWINLSDEIRAVDKVTLLVSDIYGKQIYWEDLSGEELEERHRVPLNAVADGFYLLTIFTKDYNPTVLKFEVLR